MKRAIIFDFGGVLMKTRDHTPRYLWDSRLGLAKGSVERVVHNADSWVKAQTGTLSPQAYWEDVRQQLRISAEDVRQLAVDFYSGDVLDTELTGLIRRYRSDGYPVALLSNDSSELMPKLERLDLVALFDLLVISAQIGAMKPAAAAYEAVLDRLAMPAHQTIFVDDRPENVEGANALGIHGIHYTDGMDLAARLESLLIDAT